MTIYLARGISIYFPVNLRLVYVYSTFYYVVFNRESVTDAVFAPMLLVKLRHVILLLFSIRYPVLSPNSFNLFWSFCFRVCWNILSPLFLSCMLTLMLLFHQGHLAIFLLQILVYNFYFCSPCDVVSVHWYNFVNIKVFLNGSRIRVSFLKNSEKNIQFESVSFHLTDERVLSLK